MKKKNTYLLNIKDAFKTLSAGLKLTMKHGTDTGKKASSTDPIWSDDYFKDGDEPFTLQYPTQKFDLPDNSRNKLHNEIEDCIVCDKCAKICPVDCIEIEAIRSPDEIGKTSDGTTKRLYAARFDIDMAKCCFCGLCTTVCPTECLTMTKEYDYTSYDFADHNFEFGEMTPLEILEKKQAWEKHQEEKEKEKAAKASAAKPVAKVKPAMPSRPSEEKKAGGFDNDTSTAAAKPKPTFKPKMKPKVDTSAKTESQAETPKPVFKPKVKPSIPKKPDETKDESTEAAKPRPVFKPKIKSTAPKEASSQEQTNNEEEKPKAKPVFRPKMKPVVKKKTDEDEDKNSSES
ncbi:4Fe-4S dicluster domain-containing protein [Fulvivirgaceae bacterium LMO-SS25]